MPALRELILPMEVIGPGTPIPDLCRNLPGKSIIRLSDRGDFDGLVGVLPTYVEETGADVVETIELMRRKLDHTDAIPEVRFAQHEDPAFKQHRSTVLIQPYQDCPRVSIADHPNRPGYYLITWVRSGRRTADEFGSYLFREDATLATTYCSDVLLNHQKVPAMIEAHKAIQNSGLIRDDWSFHVEGGDDGDRSAPYIYQVRSLVRKAVADFRINDPRARNRLSFGVSKGITLPVIHLKSSRDWKKFVDQDQEDWALYKAQFFRPGPGEEDLFDYDLEFLPRRMKAYLADTSFFTGKVTLEHDNLRMVKWADISVLAAPEDHGMRLVKDPLVVRSALLPNRVKIASDGVRSLIERAF